jgi:hypothetical protein
MSINLAQEMHSLILEKTIVTLLAFKKCILHKGNNIFSLVSSLIRALFSDLSVGDSFISLFPLSLE